MLNQILHFSGIVFWILVIAFVFFNFKYDVESFFREKFRQYNDFCYLKNINMTESEFNTWMKTDRDKMTKEDLANWRKENERWASSWIPYHLVLKPKKSQSKKK